MWAAIAAAAGQAVQATQAQQTAPEQMGGPISIGGINFGVPPWQNGVRPLSAGFAGGGEMSPVMLIALGIGAVLLLKTMKVI